MQHLLNGETRISFRYIMPQALLPSSAAAFAPRKPPIVVLDVNVPQWLTVTLQRVSPDRRPLNNPKHQTDYLTKILSPESATWELCSMMLEGLLEMIHIQAYVVHVDMVSRKEVAFKLTKETISALAGFHEEFQSVNPWNWPGKQAQMDKLQEEFVKAANKFVYRTNAEALEGLEEDGSGELLCDNSADAKAAISRLFVPLEPPSCVVHIIRPVVLPLSSGTKPRTCKLTRLFEGNSWNTQPDIHTPNTKDHLNSSHGDSLHLSDA